MEFETSVTFVGSGGSLGLGIEGYQFPKIANHEWDSNWLMVSGNAVLDGRSWSFCDPCLTTFETQQLANWLDQITSGKVEQKYCCFTEPNLDFEVLSDNTIRIGFSLEALPPWIDQNSETEDTGLCIPIDDRLGVAANSLRVLLARFPVRARNGS